jgi:two-component system, cell cycle sensor histidine kinase and response regulator CckA
MDICSNSFDKSIELNTIYYHEKAITKADSTQMEQVLLNLCINSLHAMTIMRKDNIAQKGVLTIVVDKVYIDKNSINVFPEAKEGNYWTLSVHDTGVGMDNNTISKVFDPFFSKKSDGKGTGLGLTIAYSIIRQHKGFIKIYSELNIGTAFHVYLPVLENDMESKPNNELGQEIPRGSGLILVIDDEEPIRRIAKDILEESGYKVILAKDGQEGIEIFKNQHNNISAVLLDMIMPKKSGLIAFSEMKEIDKNLKVLLASGYKYDERVQEAMHQGVKEFIQKPYTFENLALAIAKVIKSD